MRRLDLPGDHPGDGRVMDAELLRDGMGGNALADPELGHEQPAFLNQPLLPSRHAHEYLTPMYD